MQFIHWMSMKLNVGLLSIMISLFPLSRLKWVQNQCIASLFCLLFHVTGENICKMKRTWGSREKRRPFPERVIKQRHDLLLGGYGFIDEIGWTSQQHVLHDWYGEEAYFLILWAAGDASPEPRFTVTLKSPKKVGSLPVRTCGRHFFHRPWWQIGGILAGFICVLLCSFKRLYLWDNFGL